MWARIPQTLKMHQCFGKKKKKKITFFHVCSSSDQLLKAKSHTLTGGLGLHFCKGRRNINRKGEGWRCWVFTHFWSTGPQRVPFYLFIYFFIAVAVPYFSKNHSVPTESNNCEKDKSLHQTSRGWLEKRKSKDKTYQAIYYRRIEMILILWWDG